MFSITLGVVQPLKSVRVSYTRCVIWLQLLPVAPLPGLEAFSIDPGANAKFILLDLDLVILAFFVGATSTVAGGLFWMEVSYLISSKNEKKKSKNKIDCGQRC